VALVFWESEMKKNLTQPRIIRMRIKERGIESRLERRSGNRIAVAMGKPFSFKE